mmetsp:Transcript_26597/g.51833  ORF Transcript_26597/g.51833 Transcript_26597/m.51833 type:complete len:1003 (-) Transcript_26597:623-3631(-)
MTAPVVPRKPDSDKRHYRVVELPNKLTVVLCSDPETQSAAAALAVAAGQLQDSPEVQGLAHFLEHMLFLGNEKYPGESDFDSFCASSAGYSNAWTSMDRTVYHYVLAHDKLKDSLDRFSGFFSCPLFSADLTDRELNAIESENNKNLQDDGRREFQLLRSTARASHPLQRFGTGNLYSLKEVPEKAGTNTRQHLLDFYKSKYSANIMKLAVLGREDLDTLEAWVREYFAAVPNSDIEPLQGTKGDGDPFDAGWKRVYRIIPVKERRKLVLFFPCPNTYDVYRTKPHRLISHCIGHEGPGSLLSLLKKKGWATELGAGTGTQSTHFAIFEISIKLTEQGLPNYLEIISLVFQYFNVCFRKGSHADRSRILEEEAKIQELNFRYRTKVREDDWTEQLCCNLTRYAKEDAICGPDLFFEQADQAGIDKIMDDYFHPANMRAHLVAPEKEQPGLPADAKWEEEFWYKSKYLAFDIDAKHTAAWTSSDLKCDDSLHLPNPNPYTPDSSEMKKGSVVGDNEAEVAPSLILDTPTLKLWHLFDTSFEQPKASAHIQLSNFCVEKTARSAICLRMTLEILHEITNEEAYEAEEAALIFDITNTSHSSICSGLRLTFKGYNAKLAVLAKRMMEKIATLDVRQHESAFNLVKEATVLDYRNRKFQQNYAHAMIGASQAFEHPFWSNDERLAECETITIEEVQTFLGEFLSEMHVECMIVGNMTAEEAADMMTTSLAPFSWGPLSPSNVPKLSYTKVPEGVTVLREQLTPDPGAVDSAVVTQLQIGPREIRTEALLELLTQMLDKEMYGQLRTIEQLGYVVSAAQIFRFNFASLRLLVQSVHPPSFLEVRIETFLKTFSTHLEGMSDADFAEHVESLITKKKEKDRSAERRCERFMNEVCSHTYVFNRKHQVAEVLATLSKADLVAFFLEHISPASDKRKKFSSHVTGKQAIDAAAAAGGEVDVTAESAGQVLIFAKGAVPFPTDGNADTELPEPTVVSISEYRTKAECYTTQ